MLDNIVAELKTRLSKITEGKRQTDYAVTFLRGALAATTDADAKVEILSKISDVAENGVEAL